MHRRGLLVVAAALVGCSSSGGPPTPAPSTGPLVRMQFDRPDFYAAPFPSDDLVQPDGSIAIGSFPNPNGVSLVAQAAAIAGSSARGFAESGGVFFSLTGSIASTSLPDMASSVTSGATVFLMGVTRGAPDYLVRYPVEVDYVDDGGPFGAPHQLSIVPLQGIPLRPKTTYAAVVRKGAGVGASSDMTAIARGTRPAPMAPAAFDEYTAALASLGDAGVPASDIAGLAVFTTDAPTAGLAAVRDDLLSRPPPVPDAPFHLTDTFDGFCVYATTLAMPDYQAGTEPFTDSGGDWQFDASGKPVLQRTEEANFIVSVPRAPMPANGYPLNVFIRTGGGGDRPLVDRGVQPCTGCPATTPGTGPARYFAEIGIAGASVDGPHGGLRNPTNGNEDFLIFNVSNGAALRDNIRESAVELILFAHILGGISFSASDCPGVGTSPVKFDMTKLSLMGHSMGATIAPLVLAYEPMYRAAVLSGAGASWIANILYKQQPVQLASDLELLIGYLPLHRKLVTGDPVVTLFQWAEEPADPLVYTARILREPAAGEAPRDVLMEQGIVDHYIMPHIANAMSLSLGLDLAGMPLDSSAPELAGDTPLASVLSYSGRQSIALPASGNFAGAGGPVTAVVVQHPADGIEDGHEVVFQTDPPKHEYKCFLASFLGGTPSVSNGGSADAPCP